MNESIFLTIIRKIFRFDTVEILIIEQFPNA